MALGGQQQHDVNNAGHIVTDDRNKARGSSLLFLASAVWTNNTSRSIKELPFSNFLHLNEGWRTAKPGSEHVVNPMINKHGLPLPGYGGGASAVQARSQKCLLSHIPVALNQGQGHSLVSKQTVLKCVSSKPSQNLISLLTSKCMSTFNVLTVCKTAVISLDCKTLTKK